MKGIDQLKEKLPDYQGRKIRVKKKKNFRIILLI